MPPCVRLRRPSVKGNRSPRPHRFPVPDEAAAVTAARHTVVHIVRRWEVPLSEAAFDDLALLTSEVITNAVRHTRAACTVAVRWTGVRVRVEVTDMGPERPLPHGRSLEAEGGRGLLLVESLAADWGSVTVSAGKVVWFEVGAAVADPNAARLTARWAALPSFFTQTGRLIRPWRTPPVRLSPPTR